MEVTLVDAAGNNLLLTTDIPVHTFEAITCSPNPDGFTVLNSLRIASMSETQLQTACKETTERNEVCVLPAGASPRWRVLLTPALRSGAPQSEADASRLMHDLFNASQAANVQVKSLLITHFAYVRSFPTAHVLGILGALKKLAGGSFGRLGVLGIEVRDEHLPQFAALASKSLAV